MVETLLFTTNEEVIIALEKIQATFPTACIAPQEQEDSGNLPVVLDLGTVDERTWCEWALENDIFSYCKTLVLLSFDPPEWMKLVFKAHHLKEDAKKILED